MTCGLGNETYSYFGHTGIRVLDPVNNFDVVYNYGTFDFRTPNFVLKFAKGDLQYFATVHSYADFFEEYTYEKRSIYEQELLISPDLKQKLFDQLNAVLDSDERYYTYKFIDKNCTSMVVDVVNKTLGGDVIVKTQDTDKTYRSILFPYFDGHFYDQLGTSIIFGTKVDQMGTRIFLPFELKNSLDKTSFQNKPLAAKSKTLLEFAKETPKSWWNNIYTYLFILLFVIFARNKTVDKIYFDFISYWDILRYYGILLFSPRIGDELQCSII